MRRDDSPYAGEFELRLGDNWKAFADAQYDSDDKELDRASASFRYKGEENRILNIGYRFTNETPLIENGKEYNNDIEQSNFSAAYPMTRNLSFVARHNFDVTNTRILEAFLGMQYDSCCVRVSLLYRKWVDRDDLVTIPMDKLDEDNGVFLTFQIKGIAGFGSNKWDSILKDGVPGYETHNN
jgi:LPS-assembly protein